MQQHKQLPNMCRFTHLTVIRTLYISAHHVRVLPSLCDSDRAWTDCFTCQPLPEKKKKIVLGPAYAISLFPEVSCFFQYS